MESRNKPLIWKCIRCGHIWISNKKLKRDRPKFCPNLKCHSPTWYRKKLKDMSKLELKQYKQNKKNFMNSKLPDMKLILKKLVNY